MNYEPGPMVVADGQLREYLSRELRKIAASLRDSATTIFYRTSVETELSLSAADSANYRIAAHANVVRISTSNTVTMTGIADVTPNRERVLVNVGTGVLVLKNQASESSASHRFALASDWNLSANATATIWYDVASARHRGLSRT